MSIRSKWSYFGLRFLEDKTQENAFPVRSHWFYEDFDTADFSSGAISARWAKTLTKTAGSPTVGALASYAGGAVACALDATSEQEEAALHFGGQLTWDASKGFNYEALIQLPVLPGSGTQVAIGMGTAYAAGPDNLGAYIRFGLRANGTLLCETYDGTTRNSVSSGITITTTTEKHYLWINAENNAGIQFMVDGNIVAESSTFAWAPGSTLLQPYASVYKATGTGLVTLDLDVIRMWGNRV